jgi:hypothetical protein
MLNAFRTLAFVGFGMALAAIMALPFWPSRAAWSDFLLMAIVFWGLWFIAEMVAYSVRKEIEEERGDRQ